MIPRGWLVAAFFVAACSSQPPSSPSAPQRPDIVLVTIDTMRADRLGIGVTPTLDRLAASGLRFTAARTVAPLTLPAHVSVMTGRVPPAHGVRLNGVHRFDGRVPTVAGLLRHAGYRTGAFVGAYVLDRRFGLADGFETYDDQIPRGADGAERLEAERPASDVIDRALAWLQATSTSPPQFLWVHLYDPHEPYAPPADYLAAAKGDAYNGEIAFADAQVGRLLAAVTATGRPTLVVVAGDHGESLGEHGEPTHGMLLYEPAIHVPLVVAGAGVPPGERHAPVSVVDIAPTLLGAAGVPLPADLDGRSLTTPPARDERGTADEREIYAETEYPRLAGWSPLAVLADARWKLVDASRAELYDLTHDAHEQRDLAATHDATVRGMQARLAELRRGHASTPAALSDDAAERLRALGYVAAAHVPTVEAAPNPADMMPAWAAFEHALADVRAGHGARAVPALERLAARHPDAAVFQTTWARVLLDLGRARDAVTIYRRATARWPDDTSVFHNLAVAARAAGLDEEAGRAERAAIALDNDNALAHNGLGLLLADHGDPRAAREAFARAAAIDPTNARYVANLANAEAALGEPRHAEDTYRRALDLDPALPDALNGLAVVLVQSNRPAEAIPLLERALHLDASFVGARLNLGIACQEAGRTACATEAYRHVLDAPARFSREREAARQLLASMR